MQMAATGSLKIPRFKINKFTAICKFLDDIIELTIHNHQLTCKTERKHNRKKIYGIKSDPFFTKVLNSALVLIINLIYMDR